MMPPSRKPSRRYRYATRSKYFETSGIGGTENKSPKNTSTKAKSTINERSRRTCKHNGGKHDEDEDEVFGAIEDVGNKQSEDEDGEVEEEEEEERDEEGEEEQEEGDEVEEIEDEDGDMEDNEGDNLHDLDAQETKRKSSNNSGAVRQMNKKPRLSDAAGSSIKEGCIDSNTISFLKKLAKNNNRPWFAENDAHYRTAKQDFDRFVEKLSQRIVEDIDTTIPELPLKDLVFRIYRDIRFSNDQTPYKIYLSAAWSRTGRKGPYAHYYLQIQPHGKSIIAGGIWHANAQALGLLRRAISRRPEQLKEILTRDGIAKDFLDIKGKINDKAVVNAFVVKNSEDALKSAPKGFPKDHSEIVLLRLRSFTISRSFADEEVLDSDFLDKTANLLSKIEPLVTYLNSIVMPDLNIDASDAESSD